MVNIQLKGLSVLILLILGAYITDNHLLQNNKANIECNKESCLSEEELILAENQKKPQFSTIQNCQLYNNQESCALCYPEFVLSEANRKCVKGQIDNCLDFITINSCSKCKVGFNLSNSGKFCNLEVVSFPADQTETRRQSGINWSGGKAPPKSNKLPVQTIGDIYFGGEDGEGSSQQQQKPTQVPPVHQQGGEDGEGGHQYDEYFNNHRYIHQNRDFNKIKQQAARKEDLRKKGGQTTNYFSDGESSDGENKLSLKLVQIQREENNVQVAAFIGMLNNHY